MRGKGNKSRIVPIGAETLRILWRYVRQYRRAKPGVTTLFVSRSGKSLSLNAMRLIGLRVFAAAGIPGGWHRCRHTALTLMARNGMPVWELQKIAGHSSVTMTQHYVHMSDADIITGRQYSPLDRLRS